MRRLGVIVALGAQRTTVAGVQATHLGRISTMRNVTAPMGSGGLVRR